MKAKELRQKNQVELQDLLKKTKSEFVDVTFQQAIRKLKAHTDIPKKRKLIARIETLLREQQ